MSKEHLQDSGQATEAQAAQDAPELASPLLDFTEKPPEPLAAGPVALGVWELAWPTIASFAAQTLVRFVDFAMVGALGPTALAAVGLGGQAFWLVQALSMLVPVGMAAVLARAVGAGDAALADRVLRQSLVLATGVALSITLVGLPFTDYAIRIYGVEEAVVALGSDYVFWLLCGTIPFALALVFGGALRAAGDSRTPLVVGIVTNFLNVALNYALIYGHWGFPAYGVGGAAMASSLAMVFQVVVFVWLWQRRKLLLLPGQASFRPDPRLLRRIAVIGYPSSIEQGVFHLGLIGFQWIMGFYGTASIAAYNVGVQILSLSFIPGFGFATAAGTLVGQHLGNKAPDQAVRAAWRATRGAVACMTSVGLGILLFAEPMVGLFTNDAEVGRLSVDFIWIFVVVQPFMAIDHGIGGSLRGAGDTTFPMLANFFGLFVVRLIPAMLAAFVFEAPLQIVWCALICDYAVKASLMVLRFRQGYWKTLSV